MSRAWAMVIVVLAGGCKSAGGSDAGAAPDASLADASLADASLVDAAGPAVLTQHNDNLRSGANLAETALSTSTLSRFGLLFSRAVEGYVYAQPLVVPGLVIGGRARTTLFVATQRNQLYAFDVDDPAAAQPLWQISFEPPIPSTDFDADNGQPYRDIIPELGVTSTPVIDLAAGTLFVFAQTKEPAGMVNRIHALDLLTGAERPHSPITVSIQAPGTGLGSNNGLVTLPPRYVLQRPGLALDRGRLWVAGGGHGDFGPYHGWVLAFDEATLALRGTVLTTPDGQWGGIWQAGNGIAIDPDGEVYFQTGNGSFDPSTDSPNLGDSFGRAHLDAAGLRIVDWFTPFNQADLDARDLDLGSSGPLIIPGTRFLVGGGKQGKLYLLDRGAMGHNRPSDDGQVVQSFAATSDELDSGPVYWAGARGARLYILGRNDSIRAYRFLGDRFETTPYLTSTLVMPPGTPGGAISLSANGDRAGILWALTQADDNQDGQNTGQAALHAFDADDLGHELYSSLDRPADAVGSYVKFSLPTVCAGKVFVPSADGAVRVYGLR